MSEFQDWCNKPEVVLTGNGWGVRISGCDVFDPINQRGVKSFRAFDVVKGLPTKEEASSFLANWLKEQLPDYDVLAAENERLRQELADPHRLARHSKRLVEELRARVAELERDAARWKRDSELLSAIEGECWDVRFLSTPNADAGDSSISIEIVGHFMAAPCERVVGENYNENLRAALEQAMTAEDYPPARPEYDERGRPVAALAQSAKETQQ